MMQVLEKVGGAGGGNRTRDIQLGKLERPLSDQWLACKTSRFRPQLLQWVSTFLQNRKGVSP